MNVRHCFPIAWLEIEKAGQLRDTILVVDKVNDITDLAKVNTAIRIVIKTFIVPGGTK